MAAIPELPPLLRAGEVRRRRPKGAPAPLGIPECWTAPNGAEAPAARPPAPATEDRDEATRAAGARHLLAKRPKGRLYERDPVPLRGYGSEVSQVLATPRPRLSLRSAAPGTSGA